MMVDCPTRAVPALDPYAMRTRSIRIHGVVTSVGLENFCWEVLLRIAHQHRLTLNQQVNRLHDDFTLGKTNASNFCSFLRIFCMQYLSSSKLQREVCQVEFLHPQSSLLTACV